MTPRRSGLRGLASPGLRGLGSPAWLGLSDTELGMDLGLPDLSYLGSPGACVGVIGWRFDGTCGEEGDLAMGCCAGLLGRWRGMSGGGAVHDVNQRMDLSLPSMEEQFAAPQHS